jgi:hypothetical protein
MKKILVLMVVTVNLLLSQGSGKFEQGFDSLKWGMTANQVKVLLASDTISEMKVEYFSDIVVKVDGQLSEHTMQEVNATIARINYPLQFKCIFIDNKLCGIDIGKSTPSYRENAYYNEIYKRFEYLEERNFFTQKEKYPYVGNWRIDGRVLIQSKNNDKVHLFLNEMKKIYDILIEQRDRHYMPSVKG